MTTTDRLVQRYLDRIPDARRLHATDATYRAHTRLLRTFMALMDIAMEDNCIPDQVRERVLREVLLGAAPDTGAAQERIDRFAEQLHTTRVVTDAEFPRRRGDPT